MTTQVSTRREEELPRCPSCASGDVLKIVYGLISDPFVFAQELRHTCASVLFRHGLNLKQLAAWLGHADPSFTLRTYIHLLPGDQAESPFEAEAHRDAPKPVDVAA